MRTTTKGHFQHCPLWLLLSWRWNRKKNVMENKFFRNWKTADKSHIKNNILLASAVHTRPSIIICRIRKRISFSIMLKMERISHLVLFWTWKNSSLMILIKKVRLKSFYWKGVLNHTQHHNNFLRLIHQPELSGRILKANWQVGPALRVLGGCLLDARRSKASMRVLATRSHRLLVHNLQWRRGKIVQWKLGRITQVMGLSCWLNVGELLQYVVESWRAVPTLAEIVLFARRNRNSKQVNRTEIKESRHSCGVNHSLLKF